MRVLFSSAAAVAVLAAGLAFFFLNGTPSLALADVVKAAEAHKLVRMQMTQITDDKTGRGETTSTVYWDLTSPRCRSESQVGDQHLVDIQDNVNGRQLMTNSKSKAATLFIDKPQNWCFLGNLKKLQGRTETTSAKARLDEREVVKYSLKEGDDTTTLWVDPKTKLLVRMEYEMVNPAANVSNKWTWTDFEWDPELKNVKGPDELFSTTPPQGYTVKEVDKSREAK